MSLHTPETRRNPFYALSFALNAGPIRLIFALGRFIWTRARRRAVCTCTYCGSSLRVDAVNCTNCGAALPPPPPAPSKDEPSTKARVVTGVLWYLGGFLGLHCYAAGRHLRGLLYLVCSIGAFFLLMSLDSSGRMGTGGLWVGGFLTLLWVFDGVQIIRGRFN